MAREATADHCSILRATRHVVAGSLFNVDIDPAVREFTGWYDQRHGARPHAEAAEALADKWMSGVIAETWFAVSQDPAPPMPADQ